jgi:hypothetical protein
MLKRMPAGLGGEDAGEAQRRSYLTNLIGIRNAVKVTKILCDRLNLWQPKLVVLLAEATFAAICLPGGPSAASKHPHLRIINCFTSNIKRVEQEPNVHHF